MLGVRSAPGLQAEPLVTHAHTNMHTLTCTH